MFVISHMLTNVLSHLTMNNKISLEKKCDADFYNKNMAVFIKLNI